MSDFSVFGQFYLPLSYVKTYNTFGIQFLSNITHKSYLREEFILEASRTRLRTQLHKVFLAVVYFIHIYIHEQEIY